MLAFLGVQEVNSFFTYSHVLDLNFWLSNLLLFSATFVFASCHDVSLILSTYAD
jgi:hypothetical protein